MEFRYGVHFTSNVFHPDNPLLSEIISGSGELPKKVLFVVDEGVCTPERRLLEQIDRYCRIHGDAINGVSAPVVLPGGEALKNSDQYLNIVRELINRHGLCRHSLVVAIGGGALLDMAGYAAATSHRGVQLVRLPSTVLAQNDSGVGVKTSINLFGKKNFLGTFTPPHAVINDFEFLESLCDRDWRGGVAEAIKVALIKDSKFFERIESLVPALNSRDLAAMQEVVYRCAELHLQHIGGSDPFECGTSRPLDFGHWAAHKLEQLTGYRLRHGEAVAVGIALDVTYSHLTGLLPRSDWRRIMDLLGELGFLLYVPEMEEGPEMEPGSLLEGLREFREHLGGELTIMLLEGIGRGVEVNQMDTAVVMRSVGVLKQLRSDVRTAAAVSSV